MNRTGDLIRTLTFLSFALGGALLSASESLPTQAATAPKTLTETIPGTVVAFELVSVPEGSVTLGGASIKVESFQIGRTEVTWDMYDVFALGLDRHESGGADATTRPSQPYGAPDYNWGHNGFPVISVTRHAAEQFCKWLSARTGKAYRLPTEAEWLRAADLAAKPNSTDASREAMTWHAGNAKGTSHAAAKRQPDALGLYDLFGNAAEWVIAAGGELVTRGGSFRDALQATGPAARIPYDLSWQERDPQLPKSKWWLSDGPFVGFRLALSDKK